MQSLDTLNHFLKFANIQTIPTANSGQPQSNLVQPPLLSGQPPKRESEALNREASLGASGNAVSIKPSTDSKKPIK
jgi:hypothetical protein